MGHERRVFVPLQSNVQGTEIHLEEPDAHHLRTVVRLEPGDPITVVDKGSGNSFASFVSSNERPFIITLGPKIGASALTPVVRTLLFALCKNKTNDLIAERATELGVEAILFFQAERSVVRYSTEEERTKRSERLQKIALEASKQSARNTVPSVLVTSDIKNVIAQLGSFSSKGDRFFVGSLAPEAKALPRLSPLTGSAHVLIGPEGDLTKKEEDFLIENNFERFTLGSNRLRAETAASAAITAIGIFGALCR